MFSDEGNIPSSSTFRKRCPCRPTFKNLPGSETAADSVLKLSMGLAVQVGAWADCVSSCLQEAVFSNFCFNFAHISPFSGPGIPRWSWGRRHLLEEIG